VARRLLRFWTPKVLAAYTMSGWIKRQNLAGKVKLLLARYYERASKKCAPDVWSGAHLCLERAL